METYKVLVHPSVISYNYRIAWTWEEMEKRNIYNNNVDDLRIAFWLNARPYGRPLYSEWTTHWGKKRFYIPNDNWKWEELLKSSWLKKTTD